jgi:hypothetical protein
MNRLPLLLLLSLFGCAAQASGTANDPTPFVPKPTEYSLDDCGSFVGWKALMATHCHGADSLNGAICEVDGGAVETSRAVDERTWECATTWDDSAHGGSICVHLTCETATVDGGAK